MSFAQTTRQRTRSRLTGRYATIARCEYCKAPTGASYISHPVGDRLGIGHVLCGKQECYDKASKDATEVLSKCSQPN